MKVFHYPSLIVAPSACPVYRNSGWQADTLAAETLMPYEAVKNVSVWEIERLYGVSPTAALYRREKIDKEAMRYR